jgi:hypothetical protein
VPVFNNLHRPAAPEPSTSNPGIQRMTVIENQQATPGLRRWQVIASVTAVIAILVALVHWGGTATPGPLFAVGISALIAILLVFGGLTYWLYLSPMPERQRVKPSERSATVKQVIAVLMLIAGFLFIVGLSWDENWHRQYGVGEVIDDFWWRPHLMMYGAIATMAVFALVGIWVILRSRGSLRQRFRREPQFGMLALACGYLVINAPIDPLWHQIYGLDITAWSLPHISLAIGICIALLAGFSIQLSVMPVSRWRFLGAIHWREVIALAFIMQIQLILFQFFGVEYDGIETVGGGAPVGFWARPEWIYPVLMVCIATLTGMIAVNSLRRAGAAGVLGIGALVIRTLTLAALGSAVFGMTANPQIYAIAPLLAIDLVYGLRLRQAAAWRTAMLACLAAALAVILIDLPLISRMMVFPRVNAETIPGMILWSVVFALAFGWAGWKLGSALAVFGRPVAEPAGADAHRAALAGAVAVIAAAAFIVYFIGTATPPVT